MQYNHNKKSKTIYTCGKIIYLILIFARVYSSMSVRDFYLFGYLISVFMITILLRWTFMAEIGHCLVVGCAVVSEGRIFGTLYYVAVLRCWRTACGKNFWILHYNNKWYYTLYWLPRSLLLVSRWAWVSIFSNTFIWLWCVVMCAHSAPNVLHIYSYSSQNQLK